MSDKMRKNPSFIGVAGRAGAGKDPVAQTIVGCLDGPSAIIPFATGLKEMLAGRYGIAVGSIEYHNLFFTKKGKNTVHERALVPGNTVRKDLQMMGDATRAMDPDIWVRDVMQRGREMGVDYVVCPDLRYPNELQYMDYAVWVGGDEEGDHSSESALNSSFFGDKAKLQEGSVSETRKFVAELMLSQDGSLWKSFWGEDYMIPFKVYAPAKDADHDKICAVLEEYRELIHARIREIWIGMKEKKPLDKDASATEKMETAIQEMMGEQLSPALNATTMYAFSLSQKYKETGKFND